MFLTQYQSVVIILVSGHLLAPRPILLHAHARRLEEFFSIFGFAFSWLLFDIIIGIDQNDDDSTHYTSETLYINCNCSDRVTRKTTNRDCNSNFQRGRMAHIKIINKKFFQTNQKDHDCEGVAKNVVRDWVVTEAEDTRPRPKNTKCGREDFFGQADVIRTANKKKRASEEGPRNSYE